MTVTLNKLKNKFADFIIDNVDGLVLGSGGHDVSGEVLADNNNLADLNNRILKVNVSSVEKSDNYNVVCNTTLDRDDTAQIDDSIISEMGIVDFDDSLICSKNIPPKIVDINESYRFVIKVEL